MAVPRPASAQQDESSAAPDLAAIERGRELFFRKWEVSAGPAQLGDGLGPMYNAQSCADCHNQGGPGGSGAKDRNVDLLSVILPSNKLIDRTKLVEEMQKIHPGFVVPLLNSTAVGSSPLLGLDGRPVNPVETPKAPSAETNLANLTVSPSITLHRFGTNPAYNLWRVHLITRVRSRSPKWPEGVGLILSQRRAPALFGAGVIDSISENDLGSNSFFVGSSLISRGGYRVTFTRGKFGWRGQTTTLRDFVLGACANELGLRVEGFDQTKDPLGLPETSLAKDMTKQQCDDLVAYVASLPAPQAKVDLSPSEALAAQAGESVFSWIGCAQCHGPSLGRVSGIYSDLLLHDMGSELADPANPVSQVGSSRSAQYYGGPTNVFTSPQSFTYQMWRTPPLWGVAQAAPYLHDGRAPTLDAAIRAHGGEAEVSRQKYASISTKDRNSLLTFLGTLGVKD